MKWLGKQLHDAAIKAERSIVFMHAYPADLKENAEDVAALFARHGVVLVDMGHTHYNELANDGRTIYAATRSTGQIEEGPPGFSVVTFDKGGVSWRFKPLGEPWPIAMITAPVDCRLTMLASSRAQSAGSIEVRALTWSANRIVSVACAIDDRPWLPMSHAAGSILWSCHVPVSQERFSIRLRAEDAKGGIATDLITVAPVGTLPKRAF